MSLIFVRKNKERGAIGKNFRRWEKKVNYIAEKIDLTTEKEGGHLVLLVVTDSRVVSKRGALFLETFQKRWLLTSLKRSGGKTKEKEKDIYPQV